MTDDIRRIIITSDGSSTVFDPVHNENFHSLHGAVTESMHVFIQNGLHSMKKKRISILEVGFGSGLNCVLSFTHKSEEQAIHYTGIEKYPLSKNIYSKLNYSTFSIEEKELFQKINEAEWNCEYEVSPGTYLHKISMDILEFESKRKFDLIYFDAFSPEVQPELWTNSIFKKMYDLLHNDGVLVTYSSKGIVKKALREAGFTVFRLPGPPMKRHVTKAVKQFS